MGPPMLRLLIGKSENESSVYYVARDMASLILPECVNFMEQELEQDEIHVWLNGNNILHEMVDSKREWERKKRGEFLSQRRA